MFTSILQKISILAVLFVFLGFSTTIAQGVEKPISIDLSDTPLSEVLKLFEKEHSVRFVYNYFLIKNKKVSCSFKNRPLLEVINKILEKNGLKIGYKKGNLITIIECDKTSYDIYGILVDKISKEPLPFASLEIKEKKLTTVTDKNGRFSFVNIEKSEFNIEVRNLGYKTKQVYINCLKKNNIVIELTSSPFIIPDIEVLDIKNQVVEIDNTPGLFAVSPRNYENLPIFFSPDLMRSLQLMPGITSSSGGEAELCIRGGGPSENLITLDGLQLYQLNHFFGLYSSLSSVSIKNIRVYKGGFPAKYGSKISGVIDMSSKNGNLVKPKLQVGINSLNANLSFEIPVSKKFSLIMSGRRIIFPGQLKSFYKKLISNKIAGDLFVDGQKFDKDPSIFFGDAFAKATYLVSDNDVISASLLFTEDNNSINFDDLGGFYGEYIDSLKKKVYTNNYEKTFWANKGYSVNWFRQWSSRIKTNLAASASLFKSNYNYWVNFPSDGMKIFEFRQKNILEHNTIDFELSHKISSVIDYNMGFRIDKSSIEYSDLKNDATVLQINNSKDKPFYLAGFFQNKMNFFNRLNVIAGLRTTYNELTNKIYYEPRIQSILSFGKNWVLKSSFGSYRQFVIKNLDVNWHISGNVAWVAANGKNILVSGANHFTLGTKYETEKFVIDFDFFYNKKYNIFAFNSFRNYYNNEIGFRNKAKGYNTGFEIQLIKKLGIITGWLSFTYNKSEFSSIINKKKVKFTPNDNVPVALKLVFQLNQPSWHFALVCNYTTGKPYTKPNVINEGGKVKLLFPDEINKKRLDDMLRFDVSFVKKVDFGFCKGEAGISIYNLFNASAILNRYYYLKYEVDTNEVFSKLNKAERIDFDFTPSLFLKFSF